MFHIRHAGKSRKGLFSAMTVSRKREDEPYLPKPNAPTPHNDCTSLCLRKFLASDTRRPMP